MAANSNTTIAKTRNYTPLIIMLTMAINGLVILAFYIPAPAAVSGINFKFLPLLNAILNGMNFITLTAALIAIKNKNISLHRKFIFTALFFTGLFLVSYLLYHFSTEPTRFGGTGPIRYIYYFVLITHVILAAVIVPLALISVGRGLNMDVEKHRKIGKITLPLWLYVSFTGVVTYIMIAPYY
jgi:putative membrane protein